MSASSIPNLLSFRGSRGGGGGARGRGRSRGGHGHGPPGSRRSGPDQDEIVQGTDTDAAVSRMSAVELGYLQDPFAQFFVTSAAGPAGATRRLPIINRGTYTRTTALDRLIESFLSSSSGGPKQIISLGAGTDTRVLRILSSTRWAMAEIIYHEIDFPSMASRKLRIAQSVPAVRAVLGDISVSSSSGLSSMPGPAPTPIPSAVPQPPPPPPRNGGQGEGAETEPRTHVPTTWTATPTTHSYFTFTGLDLRDLPSQPPSVLKGLQTDIPTLLLSECCLCYLTPSSASSIISWFTSIIQNIAIALYEPVRPDDSFGKMMVSNLAARNICMPTLEVYKEVSDQERRLVQVGFERVKVRTVKEIWDRWVDEEEKERVDALEGLDEVEEWELLAGHYVVAWGWRGGGFERWEENGW